MSASARQPGSSGAAAGPGEGLPGRVRAVLGAWSAALAGRRQEERLWEAAIADAHALAERGRAMSREAARQARGRSGPR